MPRSRVSTILLAAAAAAAAVAAYVLRPGHTQDASAPMFQVILIKPGSFYARQLAEAIEAGGTVPPEIVDYSADAFAFPLAEVKREAAGGAFLDLMRSEPALGAALRNAAVLRVRDGGRITAEGGNALSDGNLTVLVIPEEIVATFDSKRTAFQVIRMRVSGLLQQ